jgi:chemotaxis protein CheD
MGEESPPDRVFLQPAGIVVANQPALIRTVLGSCVAITMRSPRLGLAAVAHCLLPHAGAPAATLAPAEALRYVDSTVDLMLMAFARCGVTPREIEVKLFGGADNMNAADPGRGYQVGKRNVETALAALGERGIVPAARGVGGRSGRVIDFDTASGEVLVRRLPRGVTGECR